MGENILASKRIKVALLSPGAIGETALTHFATAFAKVMLREVNLDYISATSGKYNGIRFKPIIDFRADDYDVVHFQWGNNPLHLFEFSALLKISQRKRRPLIVSTLHEADLGYLLGASGQALRYRWYFRFRSGGRTLPKGSSEYEFFSHQTVAEILKRSDWVIVHSEYAKNRIVSEHSLSVEQSAKIQIANLGIDWDEYATTKESYEEPDRECRGKPMVFLYVGSLHAIKSVDKIIKGLQLCRHFGRRNDFYLVIVGFGPEYDTLRELAEALIPGQYSFAGMVPSLLAYYRLADVVLCPRAFSRGEISGVIPEACAAGKPVLLPNIGGWGEYIDGSRGFLVAADDELEYAQAILYCLENPLGVKERGENARCFAKNHLSWQSQTDFFLSLYSGAFRGTC
jgi:glycosyltransferase involved in cell wall biosynthesis